MTRLAIVYGVTQCLQLSTTVYGIKIAVLVTTSYMQFTVHHFVQG